MTRQSPDDMWWQRCDLSKETKKQSSAVSYHYYRTYLNVSPYNVC